MSRGELGIRSLIIICTDSTLAAAVGTDYKGMVLVALYAIAIPLSFVSTLLAMAIYVLVAAIWFIPDRRIEKITPF